MRVDIQKEQISRKIFVHFSIQLKQKFPSVYFFLFVSCLLRQWSLRN